VSVRVLIADDSAAFLDAASILLERQGLSVVGLASTTCAAIHQTEQARPDVVLVDIALGTESGFELARRLVDATQGAHPTVILISTHAEADFTDMIATSPAVGFLAKSQLSADPILRLHEARPR
jgi:DNA-binding NarL/FixJ family response regulator